MGLFGFLDKLMGVLPIQKRKERWKNEIDNLTKEKNALLKKPATAESSRRMQFIAERISYIEQLLKNSASD